MYTATYRTKKEELDVEDSKTGLKRSISLDSGVENISNESGENDKQTSASEYLKNAVGDVLGDVLSDCVLLRPDDPVEFVADAFER